MEIFAALVGVNFRGKAATAIVKGLVINESLILAAEPSNPYDSNAVKVIDPESEEHIGYLSRESNAETAVHLGDGGEYTCTVASFLSATKPHLRIELLGDEAEATDEKGSFD